MVQLKVWLCDTWPLETVVVTVCVPTLAGLNVPEMTPVTASIVRGVGRPVAL
jgi:hypothetical protein